MAQDSCIVLFVKCRDFAAATVATDMHKTPIILAAVRVDWLNTGNLPAARGV
jgi:hypothetical protein